MKIWMIWARDNSDTSGVLWLVEAWDDDSVSGNYDGWEEAIEKAKAEYGGFNVRIASTNVDFDQIAKSFEPVEA